MASTIETATKKPTILLIHGGWHTPAHYSNLVSSLRSSGYQDIHVPALPSVSEVRPPVADLASDTEHIRSYLSSLLDKDSDESKPPKEIVVIMHSYGGQVGTNALHGFGKTSRQGEGKTGGVTTLVYVAAFALPEGGSMAGKVKEFGHEELMPLAFEFDPVDGSVLCREPRGMLVGDISTTATADTGTGVVGEKDVEGYVGSLVRWNGKCMYDGIEGKAAWREVKEVSYVYCTKDMTVPLVYQRSMVELMDRERVGLGKVHTVEIETGHCPNLTATGELVRAVEEAVALGNVA